MRIYCRFLIIFINSYLNGHIVLRNLKRRFITPKTPFSMS